MAILALTQSWVHLLPNGESDFLSAWSDNGRQRSAEVDGEIQELAGGRRRASSKEGVGYTFEITLVRLTLDQVKTLESWLGRTVLVRVHNGQSFLGTFFEVASTEYKDKLFASGISVRSVTSNEVLVI